MKTCGQRGAPPGEGAGAFGRGFKYAVVAYAVLEFIAIALLLYREAAR